MKNRTIPAAESQLRKRGRPGVFHLVLGKTAEPSKKKHARFQHPAQQQQFRAEGLSITGWGWNSWLQALRTTNYYNGFTGINNISIACRHSATATPALVGESHPRRHPADGNDRKPQPGSGEALRRRPTGELTYRPAPPLPKRVLKPPVADRNQSRTREDETRNKRQGRKGCTAKIREVSIVRWEGRSIFRTHRSPESRRAGGHQYQRHRTERADIRIPQSPLTEIFYQRIPLCATSIEPKVTFYNQYNQRAGGAGLDPQMTGQLRRPAI